VPTQGHVHQILARLGVAGECRVVYVDEDPVVKAYAQTNFTPDTRAVVIAEDLRDPTRVLGHTKTQQTLNFDEPIAVLAFAVAHFVSDEEDPVALFGDYMAGLAAGSCLAYTHVTDEFADRVAALEAVYAGANHGVYPRSFDEIEELASRNGLEPLGPGVVRITDWLAPDELRPPAQQMWIAGGIAEKRLALAP
jgi:hypothetical protein